MPSSMKVNPCYAPIALKPRPGKMPTEGELCDVERPPDIPVTLDLNDYNPLFLSVEPSKFVINPENGTKFTIKSLSKGPQDVIVTCNSYIFEIKNARGFYEMESQEFHRLKQDETMEFEIGMRDPNKPLPTSMASDSAAFASGFIKIHHYRTKNLRNDSDKAWNRQTPHQLVLPQIHEGDKYAFWKDILKPEHETDQIKKWEDEYVEKWFSHRAKLDKRLLEAEAPKDMPMLDKKPSVSQNNVDIKKEKKKKSRCDIM